MILEKYSFGIGDRFGHQGKAQLQAIINANKEGINITPVWNKSYREHTIIHTEPASVRTEADQAVEKLGWGDSYYVEAGLIPADMELLGKMVENICFNNAKNYFSMELD